MGRGHPDWGQYATTTIIAGLNDLGEAVARFGSPNIYDRRGNVIWWDDFETGFDKWNYAATSIFGVISWKAGIARLGRYSVLLRTDVNAGDYAVIWKLLPFATTSRVGLEFAFMTPQTPAYMRADLRHRTTGSTRLASIRIQPTTGIVQVSGDLVNWTTIDTLGPVLTSQDAWNVVKLVIDTKAGVMVRAIINNRETTLTQALGTLAGLASEDHLRVDLFSLGAGLANTDIYVDDVIITINEP